MNRRDYLNHFAVLFSGTAIAQLANLASYPFLARLYTPADFGVFAMFVAVSAIPSAIACGRFDLAVPTAPRAGRFAILWLCIAISALVGTLSALGSGLYWLLAAPAGAHEAMPLLLGLCVFLTGFCTASSLYLMRHGRYRLSSASVVMRTGTTVLIQVGLAFLWRHPMSLIVGFTAGLLAQAAMLAWAMRAQASPGPPRIAQMRALFRRYRRQVSVDIPSTIIAALSNNLLTFILLILYGEHVLGFYSLGQRIAIMPLQLFNDSLGQVFFQKAARSQEEKGHFWNEMKFNLILSGLLSIAILLGIWIFAEPFIRLYLGDQWAPAAEVLIILAPMLAVRSLCMSVATAVFVLRRAQWLLFHNLAVVLVLGLSYLIASQWHLGLNPFLMSVSGLLILEYGIFAGALAVVSKRGAARASVSGLKS